MNYLEMNVEVDGEFYLNRDSYIRSSEEVEMQNKTNKSRALIREEQAMLRRIFGQLNWIAAQSRPYTSFDVCQLSTKLNTATVQFKIC